MCPEFEMIDRQVTNDVSLFEAQIPFNPPQGKLIIDPKRAVKKFRRSAAGNYELSEDLRSPEVLLATTVYLMRDVLDDERWPRHNVSFSLLYAFIRDRLRAIRTDLTLLNCKNIASIRIHELSIRFLIAAGHLLCEEDRAAFEPQQNNEQLNGCLSALREMYKTVRSSNNSSTSGNVCTEKMLKYEAEFQAYSIILSVDKKEAALAISSLPLNLLQTESIQVALEAFSAFQQTNYIKFLGLIQNDHRTSYLQACLLHQFVLPVRQRALSALVSESQSGSFRTIPKTDFMRWLAFVDAAELSYYSDRFGFRLTQANQIIDLSSLIQRGEAQDLRAEEENFKVRQFHQAIEEQRRKNATLSEIMFQSLDLDLSQVMQVISSNPNSSNANPFSSSLTSEFLAAAASSPNPKTLKKIFTKSASSLKIDSIETEACAFPSNNHSALPSAFPSNSHSSFPPSNSHSAFLSTPNEVDTALPIIAPSPPKIDHQAILKKKLEAQAQDRQARKEKIDTVSISMLDALLDSIVGYHVAETCTHAWDSISIESHRKRKFTIETLSLMIFDNLIEKEILPSALDVELMKLRCRAAESLAVKGQAVHQATFSILSGLEQEIYEELVLESVLIFKSQQFMKRKWLNLMRNRGKLIEKEWQDIFNLKTQKPIHALLIGKCFENSLIEPLIKAKPPNHLGYLQSFITNLDLKIIWSTSNDNPFPFIFSYLDLDKDDFPLDLGNWPTNFPGPTVIITENNNEINLDFPWTPIFLKADNSMSFRDIISRVYDSQPPELPIINENLKPSDFIPEELIESFVIEPFERDARDQSEGLLIDLFRGFLDRLIWILFRSPQSSKLLSWHPKIAGKSRTIESARKSQSIPETFINLFSASKSIQMSLDSLDQIYGKSFVTGSLDCLYTTQSISDFVRSQNGIVNRYHCKRTRLDLPRDQTTPVDSTTRPKMTLEVLKEMLKSEATESDAYEKFLKKFL